MATPTIVIVPAACQPPSLYVPFTKALSAHSILSTVIPTPSVGASPGLKDFSADVTLTRNTVINLIDEAKDVIVLMHSYGGIPGSAALDGLGKSTREKEGKSNGVVRLVYVCSFALRVGEQMPDAGNVEMLRKYASEGLDEDVRPPGFPKCLVHTLVLISMLYIQAGTLLVTPRPAAKMLFHDLPETEAQHWSSLLLPHSLGAMWSKQSSAAWMTIPSTYVVCELDRVMSVERQEGMMEKAREVEPRAFDVVERLESGHEPVLSRVGELVGVVGRAVGGGGGW